MSASCLIFVLHKHVVVLQCLSWHQKPIDWRSRWLSFFAAWSDLLREDGMRVARPCSGVSSGHNFRCHCATEREVGAHDVLASEIQRRAKTPNHYLNGWASRERT